MKRIKLIIGLATTVCCLASTSQASLLMPGGTVFPVVADLQGFGGIVLDTLVSPYSYPTLVGTVTTEVRSGDAANPYGGLSFYYTIDNTGSSLVSRFTTTGYAGVGPVETGDIANGGTAPTYYDRTAGLGNGINANFVPTPLGLGNIPGGGLSQVMVMHTAWTTWTTTSASIIDSGLSDNFSVLAPVPEPSTVIAGALLLLPFGASTIRFLRKSRTA